MRAYIVFDYGEGCHLLDYEADATYCGVPRGWMPREVVYTVMPIDKPLCKTCQAAASERDETKPMEEKGQP
jgi:hypothetical protein